MALGVGEDVAGEADVDPFAVDDEDLGLRDVAAGVGAGERERPGADRLRGAAHAAPAAGVAGGTVERLDEEQLDGAAGRLGGGEARAQDARVVDDDERARRQQRRQIAHLAMLGLAGAAIEDVEARVVATRQRGLRDAGGREREVEVGRAHEPSAITRRCFGARLSSPSSRC